MLSPESSVLWESQNSHSHNVTNIELVAYPCFFWSLRSMSPTVCKHNLLNADVPRIHHPWKIQSIFCAAETRDKPMVIVRDFEVCMAKHDKKDWLLVFVLVIFRLVCYNDRNPTITQYNDRVWIWSLRPAIATTITQKQWSTEHARPQVWWQTTSLDTHFAKLGWRNTCFLFCWSISYIRLKLPEIIVFLL